MADSCTHFMIRLLNGFQFYTGNKVAKRFKVSFKYFPVILHLVVTTFLFLSYERTLINFFRTRVLSLIVVVLWCHALDTFLQLIEDLEIFDAHFYNIYGVKIDINHNTFQVYVDYALMILLSTNAIYWLGATAHNWESGFQSSLYLIDSVVNRVYFHIVPILFKTFIANLAYRFDQLGIAWSRIHLTDESVFEGHHTHGLILDLVDVLNESFGQQMLFSSCVHFSSVVFFSTSNSVLLLINFIYIAQLFLGMNSAADQLKMASEVVLDLLSTTSFVGLSESALLQIEVWMLQFKSSPAEISVASFFTLSRSSFVSMAIAAATYSILVLQLKQI